MLPHTYELDIKDLRLGGVSVGEIGMEAAVAGDMGVPVLLVAGDSAGMAEAQSLLPGVEVVVVKEAIERVGSNVSSAVGDGRLDSGGCGNESSGLRRR